MHSRASGSRGSEVALSEQSAITFAQMSSTTFCDAFADEVPFVHRSWEKAFGSSRPFNLIGTLTPEVTPHEEPAL